LYTLSSRGPFELLSEQPAQSQNDPQQLDRFNRKIHQTIYAAAHNQYLLQTLGQLENALALPGCTTYAVDGRA
jgi:DNA-binding GntR family transcriptional regulator